MTESFNVIALISGGKDSFFSLLHCIQNGHKVVALGNLYPAPVTRGEGVQIGVSHEAGTEEDEHDLNSFMYQTVGHTVVPLYEQALGIPLYRQAIIGTAVQTGTSYSHSDAASIGSMTLSQPQNENEDETESLVPLLRKIMVEHPAANAISTGAILSTYQRTRIESVALRLGLTPLSYLWKYPTLPPGTQMSLLQDMQDVGLDARIVKVASGGLDESFLWENVASQSVMRRIEKSMKRFGTDGDGAVLGEGGEFETLVVDGPLSLFKGRIEVREEDRRIVREGGGSAWLTILNAAVVMKDSDNLVRKECQIPDLLESRFSGVLNSLHSNELVASRLDENSKLVSSTSRLGQQLQQGPSFGVNPDSIVHWTFSAEGMSSRHTVSEEASKLIEEIQQRLSHALSDPSHIISTVIVLRSMNDFAAVNKVAPLLALWLLYISINASTGIWRHIYTTKSTSQGNHIMRILNAKEHRHHNPPQTPQAFTIITASKSITRSITFLLGTCKHRSLFSGNLNSAQRIR
jgi:diphthine-ammonia ligase